MDKYSLYVPNFIPTEEHFDLKLDHACAGCGISLAARHIGKSIQELFKGAKCQRTKGKGPVGVPSGALYLTVETDDKTILFALDDEPSGDVDGAIQKALPAAAVSKGFDYVATASPSYPFDFQDKIAKALKTEGRSFIHVLCPCPGSWDFATENTVKLGFWAVESRAFPLYEVDKGEWRLTNETLHPRPLADYINAQGRFAEVKRKELDRASGRLAKEYAKLLGMVHAG